MEHTLDTLEVLDEFHLSDREQAINMEVVIETGAKGA